VSLDGSPRQALGATRSCCLGATPRWLHSGSSPAATSVGALGAGGLPRMGRQTVPTRVLNALRRSSWGCAPGAGCPGGRSTPGALAVGGPQMGVYARIEGSAGNPRAAYARSCRVRSPRYAAVSVDGGPRHTRRCSITSRRGPPSRAGRVSEPAALGVPPGKWERSPHGAPRFRAQDARSTVSITGLLRGFQFSPSSPFAGTPWGWPMNRYVVYALEGVSSSAPTWGCSCCRASVSRCACSAPPGRCRDPSRA